MHHLHLATSGLWFVSVAFERAGGTAAAGGAPAPGSCRRYTTAVALTPATAADASVVGSGWSGDVHPVLDVHVPVPVALTAEPHDAMRPFSVSVALVCDAVAKVQEAGASLGGACASSAVKATASCSPTGCATSVTLVYAAMDVLDFCVPVAAAPTLSTTSHPAFLLLQAPRTLLPDVHGGPAVDVDAWTGEWCCWVAAATTDGRCTRERLRVSWSPLAKDLDGAVVTVACAQVALAAAVRHSLLGRQAACVPPGSPFALPVSQDARDGVQRCADAADEVLEECGGTGSVSPASALDAVLTATATLHGVLAADACPE